VLEVPGSLGELTPEYMTKALSRTFPGVSVDSLEIGVVEDGTNRRTSVKLSYANGGGPSSVFVKIHGRLLHRLALVALRAWQAEALLAASGVKLPVEHPTFYSAATDRAHVACIVIMEDVTTRDGRPNDATTALTVDEVADGLVGLAKLHAAFWDRALPSSLGFLAPWKLGRIWAPVSRASLARGFYRMRRRGQETLIPRHLDARSLERQFRTSASLAQSGPQTVLHGDPHPGNTYGLPGSRTGFFDWQLVRRGDWGHDVGYFLAGSLEIADRRAHERDLLATYLDAARASGGSPPSFGTAWERYRATPAFGLGTWMHTYSAGSFQPEQVSVATIARFSAAYEDLETHLSVLAD
jgi:hypothetical protein